MTEPSQQQSTQTKKLVPSRLDLSFTAVPYSQTYESKPPILMVPPRNPLRIAKPSPSPDAAAAPADATPSPSPVSGDAVDAPYSITGLHSVFSPLGIRQPSTPSSTLPPAAPEAERWDDVLRLSGYWDELDDFAEPPSHRVLDLKLTDHVGSVSVSGPGDAAGGAEQPALPPQKSPEPSPQAQAQDQGRQSKSQATAESSVPGEHPRRKRHFWSQIRRGRKSVSTISSETESVPPLSPLSPLSPTTPLPDDYYKNRSSRQRPSIAESSSSGCSMHTPTSAECPNDASDRLLSLHEVLATAGGPDAEDKNASGDSRDRTGCRAGAETGPATGSVPGLVSPRHKPLPAGELPHTLTVAIPEGRLFEDDFLDSLSF